MKGMNRLREELGRAHRRLTHLVAAARLPYSSRVVMLDNLLTEARRVAEGIQEIEEVVLEQHVD